MDNPEKQNKTHNTILRQTQTTQKRHETSYKHFEVEMNWTSFFYGNPNGHHNTKLRT